VRQPDGRRRYKQDLEFFLIELKQKEGLAHANRAEEAIMHAQELHLRMPNGGFASIAYRFGFITLEKLEELIERVEKKKPK
jgi:hypothetical protein